MPARLTIRWEPLTDLVADGLEDMAVSHWLEVENDQSCPLALDFKQAQVFEKQGLLKIAAVRRNDTLIGYAECMIMSGSLLYSSTRHAYVQAIYIDPVFRGFASLALIGWLESETARAGKTKIYIAAKTERQGDLYEKLGYAFSEMMFAKTVESKYVQRDSPNPLCAGQSAAIG
jgi:hypothetical protein